MNAKTTTRAAMLATATFATGLYAVDYTWLASPADAAWNTTSLNWNSGAAWVDDASSPNSAIFPDTSSQKSISIPTGETRHVNNMTVDGDGY